MDLQRGTWKGVHRVLERDTWSGVQRVLQKGTWRSRQRVLQRDPNFRRGSVIGSLALECIFGELEPCFHFFIMADANFLLPSTLRKLETQTLGGISNSKFCSRMHFWRARAMFPFFHNGQLNISHRISAKFSTKFPARFPAEFSVKFPAEFLTRFPTEFPKRFPAEFYTSFPTEFSTR